VSTGSPVADGDRGSGTVLLVGVVAVAVALLAAMALLVGAERARAGAQAAADLAALAAAARLVDGAAAGGPCAVAAAVATRNGARLVACRPGDGGVVTVTAARPAAGVGTARATARAGPAAVQGPP